MKPKREFSKLITGFLVVNVILMVWSALIVMFYLQDINSISYYITGANASMAVVMGFYFHKAGKENVIKIANALEPRVMENYNPPVYYQEPQMMEEMPPLSPFQQDLYN